MVIRRAVPEDVDAMHAMFRRESVKRDSERSRGFLEYDLTPEDIRTRIEGNGLAMVSSSDRIRGFIIAYTSELLASLAEKDGKISTDEIIHKISGLEKPFVYVDMLCSSPSLAGHWTAHKLYWNMVNEARLERASRSYAAIANNPWFNADAVRFAREVGYTYCDMITTKDGLKFGIYENRF